MSSQRAVQSRVDDVVLHIGAMPQLDGKLKWPVHTRSAVELGRGVWIGPRPDRNAIMDACEPRGENAALAVRQFPAHYAFYRTDPPNRAERYKFDRDAELRTAIQLSRLVRPTSIGYRYAARVLGVDEPSREIIPYRVGGPGYSAYVLDEEADFLWDEDVQSLVELLSRIRPRNLPRRVKRALWMYEYTSWIGVVDVRLPLLISGLEALVHTDERGRGRHALRSTEQFVTRLDKLRQFTAGVSWTTRDLDAIYEHRSRLVHGQGGGRSVLTRRGRKVVGLIDDGLRALLRACVRSRSFADVFRSEASIRTTLG